MTQRLLNHCVEFDRELRRYFWTHGPRAALDDLMQELWIRALKGREEALLEPLAYLYTVARSVIRDHLFEEYRWHLRGALTVAEPSELDVDVVADESDALGLRQALSRLVGRLPARQRTVLVLHACEGYTKEEVAELTGMSYANADKSIARAKARCRELHSYAVSLGLSRASVASEPSSIADE